MFCWRFYLFLNIILVIFFQNNYLNIHRVDLDEICRDGKILAVNERFFSIPEGTLPWQPIFVDCIFMSRQISETA